MFEFFELDTVSTNELYPDPFIGHTPWIAHVFKIVAAAPIPPIQQQRPPAPAIQAQYFTTQPPSLRTALHRIAPPSTPPTISLKASTRTSQ